MHFKQLTEKQELYDWLNFISRNYRSQLSPQEKKLLGEIRVGVLYGCKMVVLEEPGVEGHSFLSLISYTVTKRYLNIYFMLTRPDFRGAGANTAILNHIKQQHEGEFDRIYVITSTLDSVSFYANIPGFVFRGRDKHGYLVAELDVNHTSQKRKTHSLFQLEGINYCLSRKALIQELLENPKYECDVDLLIKKRIA